MKTEQSQFMRKSIALFSFLLLTLCGLKAQVASTRHYSSINGLLSDRVYGIYSDRSGYLWFNSEFGTIKYNGESFNKVLNNLPLTESFVFCIYERADGRKWCANSNANIYEIINDSAYKILGIEKLSESLKKSVSEIIQIVVDKNESIYITTKNHSYMLVFDGKNYRVRDLSSEIMGDTIRLKLFKVSSEWMPVMNRISSDEFVSDRLAMQKYFAFSGDRKPILVKNPSQRLNLRHFRERSNQIYYTNATRLSKIAENGHISEIEMGAHVMNFKIDQRNHIWVGCQNAGVFEINENDSIVSHYLDGITINDIAIDYQNGVWVSTNGAGIYRLDNEVPPLLKALDPNYPVIFGQKTEGGILIANSKAEFAFQKNQIITKLTGSKEEVPVATCTKGDKLILAYGQRIVEYNLSKESTQNKTRIAKEIIPKCSKINEMIALGGDTIVGVWRRGLNMFVKGQSVESIDFGKKIQCSVIHGDTAWMGTEDGLFFHPLRWKGQSKRIGVETVAMLKEPSNEGAATFFKSKSITAVCFDSHSNLWVGTRTNEILVHKNSHLHTLSVPPGEIINDISIGSEIIVSTNHGAFLLKGNLEKSKDINWEPLFKGEVLKCIQVDSVAYFQTGSTMAFLPLKTLSKPDKLLIFNWIGLSFDSSVTPPNNNFLVRHSSQEVRFKFERISYQAELPDIIYALVGPVISNGVSKTSEMVFSRLLPGDYTLAVSPNIYPNSANKIVIYFTVLPEWYETWWALLIAVVLVLGLTSLITVFVIRRNREKIQQKNIQEQLLIEYKLIALKAQVNPHFISNCLTAVQNLIAKGESEKANLYVAKFGLLVRKILDYSSMSLISLGEELEVVRLYIHMEEVRFGKSFEFKVNVSTDIDISDFMVPSLLLNPIIENSIWHGLLPLPKNVPASLEIVITFEKSALIIIIRDNGVGLTEKKQAVTGRTSYGLDITEQRIKNINYLLQSTVGKIEIKNRHNEQGDVLGAEVIVCLPIENKY